MRAVVVRRPGAVELARVPLPQPGDYQALVRIEACSFCSSTDLKIIAGKLPFVDQYPCLLGHESVGVVVEVGRKARHISAGQRVLRPVAAYPGEHLGEFASGWGGFAEYGLVTDWRAMVEDLVLRADAVNPWFKMHQPVPPEVPAPEATLLITLKETLSSLRRLADVAGKAVLVVGDGAVGLAFARWAKVLGAAAVAVAGHHDSRLERAAALGADWTINTRGASLADALAQAEAPARFDVVVDAVGSGEIIEQACALVAGGGAVGVYGVSVHMRATVDFLRLPVDARVVRMSTDEPAAHEQVLSAWRLGTINPRDFYTHVLPLDSAAEAVDLLRRREALKVVLTMGGS